jgi:superfamily II helicase
MPPDALADLRAKHGTPPRIPLRTWTDKTGADLAGRLEEQCDKLSTPEGITATIEGLAMELAMFGSLVAMYLVTVRHSEEDGQHLLKTTNTLRIMDKRLFENSAAMSHLRRSIANSVEFVQDKLGSDDAKQPESKLVGPNGELLT